jgi:hypothetical protein
MAAMSHKDWLSQQSHILPDCDWQHITFTMPHAVALLQQQLATPQRPVPGCHPGYTPVGA